MLQEGNHVTTENRLTRRDPTRGDCSEPVDWCASRRHSIGSDSQRNRYSKLGMGLGRACSTGSGFGSQCICQERWPPYMRHMKSLALLVLLVGVAVSVSGCLNGTETIKVEYLPGFQVQRLFTDITPLIAVNAFWDERPATDRVGEGYNLYGQKVETWVTDKDPAKIIEDAIVDQLRALGFEVVRTSGWNLDANSIPALLDADLILGGRLRAFWVESHPGMVTVSVNSRVTFDLIIADVKTRQILWAGQFTGADKAEVAVRLNTHMRDSLSRALTQAVNKVFQDEQVKSVFVEFVRVRF